MGTQGKVYIKELEPVHDPEAYERALRILGRGVYRGVMRLLEEDAAQRTQMTFEGRRPDETKHEGNQITARLRSGPSPPNITREGEIIGEKRQ